MQKNAAGRVRDLREKLRQSKSDIDKFKQGKNTAQKKLAQAEKEYKEMKKSGDHLTHFGFMAKRALDAAKEDMAKCEAAFQRATADVEDCEEKLRGAQEKASQIKAKRQGVPEQSEVAAEPKATPKAKAKAKVKKGKTAMKVMKAMKAMKAMK
eukprot:gb/GFBE01026731.1/.p1 GENE.gb/GFBE01026731.1/~~gb/GFBE01026731.1/.p1  ORF type:complete len:153 (+),score=59.57 gb/GFBE01026731.1/:1-459(+)